MNAQLIPLLFGQVIHEKLLTPNREHNVVISSYSTDMQLEEGRLRQAVTACYQRHDFLGANFLWSESKWSVQRETGCSDIVAFYDAATIDDYEMAYAATAAADEAIADLNGGSMPLFRVRVLDLGAARGSCLIIIASHYVCDAQSLDVLSQDIFRYYLNVKLPGKTVAAHHLESILTAISRRGNFESLLVSGAYQTIEDKTLALENKSTFLRTLDVHRFSRKSKAKFSVEQTIEFRNALISGRLGWMYHGVLAACVMALGKMYGSGSARIAFWTTAQALPKLEVDLKHSVGFFAFPIPVSVAHDECSPDQTLQTVVGALGRAFAQAHIWASALTCAQSRIEGQFLDAEKYPPISFNWIGEYRETANTVFWSSDLVTSPTKHSGNRRYQEIAIYSGVREGELFVNIESSSMLHEKRVVDRFLDQIIVAIREVTKMSLPH